MKITYITQSPVPSSAANSVHVMKMAQALAKAGHAVTLLSPEYKRQGAKPFITDLYSHYNVDSVFKYKSIPFIKNRRLRQSSNDFFVKLFLLLTRTQLVFTRNPDAALAGLSLGLPTIFEWHDSPANAAPKILQKFLKIIRHKNFVAMIVISQALKDEIQNQFPLPADKIIAAHDGADIIIPVPRPKLALSDKIRIGYAGHLYQGRGLDIIGAAAKNLPDYEFHIVGGNADDLLFWQAEISGTRNIIFHGQVPPSEIPGYLASFDILLSPYQRKVAVSSGSGVASSGNTASWMSPLKIFEYMASGKPIICSDLPVLKEVLRNQDNCLLCPPDDIQAWTSAINKLAEDKQLSDRLAENAFHDLKENYTWDARVKNIFAQLPALAIRK